MCACGLDARVCLPAVRVFEAAELKAVVGRGLRQQGLCYEGGPHGRVLPQLWLSGAQEPVHDHSGLLQGGGCEAPRAWARGRGRDRTQ